MMGDGHKGHPRGGPFFTHLPLALAIASSACGPPAASPLSPGVALTHSSQIGALEIYRELGYVIGEGRIDGVGRFVYLPGPADSTYAVFALSLPNAALRFRREPPGFLARYRVDISIGAGGTTVAQLSESQDVRVRTFRETSRRRESVVFQGFLKLLPGEYAARIDVRDLSSSADFAAEAELTVPALGPGTLTAPLIVYQAQPRRSRAAPPSLIISPRATVTMSEADPWVYIEGDSIAADTAILEVLAADEVIWRREVMLSDGGGRLRGALAALEWDALPPGALEIQARLPDAEARSRETLLVAPLPDWLFADYEELMSYLRYAGSAAELDSLRNARPAERARLFRLFWERRDPDPRTAENEFLEDYFRRIQDANSRFSEPATAGWLTDRGGVYVTLGPPDEVFRHLDPQQGPGRSQVWLYNRSLGFELRLVFVDENGAGSYGLTGESRRAFYEALENLYS